MIEKLKNFIRFNTDLKSLMDCLNPLFVYIITLIRDFIAIQIYINILIWIVKLLNGF